MERFKRLLFIAAFAGCSTASFAQFNESGISAGYFDSSKEKDINFSEFHLPPLAVLFENAKANPQILSVEKARQIAEAEVAKQKRHIFSYLTGHASFSYGVSDMWGNNSSSYNMRVMQFQGSEQKYWNVGVNLAVPVEDILDLGAAVKRKRLEVEQAQYQKDILYDQLKTQIGALYVKITNTLVALKTSGEAAAAYQGAGNLNKEEFENGNMSISDYAYDKLHEISVVKEYQQLQTQITTDILTLEILSHTPIITNSTTEITLDNTITKSEKELARENKALAKRIKKAEKEERKKMKALEKAELKAEKAAAKKIEEMAEEEEKASKRVAKKEKKEAEEEKPLPEEKKPLIEDKKPLAEEKKPKVEESKAAPAVEEGKKTVKRRVVIRRKK